jgi:hypothetical protein
VKAIKYINKYITKGYDCARMAVQVENNESSGNVVNYDEISQYLNCRYISSQEAVWKLQGHAVHGQSHNVIVLSVHLPDGQQIYFNESRVEEALRRSSTTNTTLTAYFTLNILDPSAHNYLYHDIPKYYIFKDNNWVKRSENSHFGSKAIGRIASVSPKNVELYHIRLLLLSVKGSDATSFEKLKTVDGISYSTYKEAALKRGFINDSNEWKDCMTEATTYMMPNALRSLYSTIVCYCNPSDPIQLLDDFEENMVEDYISLGNTSETSRYLLIQEIKKLIVDNGFDHTHLFPVSEDFSSEIIDQQIQPTLTNLVDEEVLWDKLNEQQNVIANEILKSLLGESDQKCFYIDGPGGSGKTFLYKALIQKAETINKKPLVIAWTGIAATLLPGGMTCHSVFSLPLDLSTISYPRLTNPKKEYLKSIDILIWDEAPMSHNIAFEIIDMVFRDITMSELPFGGKIMVLGGDFRQILPVVKKGSRGSIIQSTIKKSELWKLFKTYQLNTNMRASNDTIFSEWLIKVGDGDIPELGEKKTQYSVNISFNLISEDIVTDVFGESFTAAQSETFSKRAILSPRNDDVCVINEKVLNKLINVEEKCFQSIDTLTDEFGEFNAEDQANIPVEFLNSLNPSSLPPHKLKLKIGCIVILLRNLSLKKGLCNGTRLIVRDFKRNVIQLEIISGVFSGTVHFIPRIKLDTTNNNDLPFNFRRHQFPIRLAYAMTINKSQGQTFEKVGLYLPQPCFSHGQFYTGCSRVKGFDSLKIQIEETSRQGKLRNGTFVTDNVVYKEIFT